jgi:hypothetical protein
MNRSITTTADRPKSTMAEQIAPAAIPFEQRRTGNHVPKSVTVVLSEGTLVITLHEALSPAERAMARSPAGAAQVQEFHRSCLPIPDSLRQEIKRITRMEVREATAEIEPASGAVVQAFTSGTVVQVGLLRKRGAEMAAINHENGASTALATSRTSQKSVNHRVGIGARAEERQRCSWTLD